MLRRSALLLLALAYESILEAQPVNPVQTAMGGAGVTVTSGIDALGINPANLYLQTRGERFSASVWQLSAWNSSPEFTTGSSPSFTTINRDWQPWQAQTALPVNGATFEDAKSRLFKNNRSIGVMSSASGFTPVALAWRFKGRTVAAFYTQRVTSDSRISQSFYQPLTPLSAGKTTSRLLEQTFRAWSELGFTFSAEHTLVTGLHANFNHLVIGFAPRLLIGGSRFDGFHREVYSANNGGNTIARMEASQQSAGTFTTLSQSITQTGVAPSGFASELFSPSGIGAAFDIGFTYVMPGGEDFSLFNSNAPAGFLPGVKISAAVRDLGFLSWNNATSGTASADSLLFAQMPAVSPWAGNAGVSAFTGAPGAFNGFLGTGATPSHQQTLTQHREQLAPTLQTGFSASNKWITVAFEYRFRVLNMKSDQETHLFHSGVELRPFGWIPIRGGIQLQRELPPFYSAGIGLNARWFQADAGIMWAEDRSYTNGRRPVSLSYRFIARF
jgi:hypothetical protein